MQHQLTITLPSDIPLPKFRLFQQVIVSSGTLKGFITGMEYTDFRAALRDGCLSGWEYTISRVYGVSEIEAMRAPESTTGVPESELTLADDVQGGVA